MSERALTAKDISEWSAKKLRRWAKAPSDAPTGPGGRTWQVPLASPAATLLVLLARAYQRVGLGAPGMRLLQWWSSRISDPRKRAEWELAKFLRRAEWNAASPTERRVWREKRLEALERACRSTDKDTRTHAAVLLADELHRSGQHAEGERAADLALKTSPGHPKALQARANNVLAQGRMGEAPALYRELAERSPAHPDPSVAPAEQSAGNVLRGSAAAAADAILVGVGGGVGDILHVTPMLRNLARRSGRPVEVLVMADHPGAEFLVDNASVVRAVHGFPDALLERPFGDVLLTHSFGLRRFPFHADRVLISDNWHRFRPGVLNETIFNLEAARALVGISYDESDIPAYFVGNVVRARPSEILVGMHAGSKAGRWLSKRWPQFEMLAEALSARGIPVASFGTADEYVPGTENRTGGSIGEMCRSIACCSHFVSNDSGPMHIASALGIPTLALFAPTDPVTHASLSSNTTNLQLCKTCAPCEVKNHLHFASEKCRCIAEIRLPAVEKKLLQIIEAGVSNNVDSGP